MGTNNFLFRSQFDISGIVPPILATVFLIWLFHFPPFCISVWLLILIGVLFNYLILAIFRSRYYFYDNHIVRIFPFRLVFRKKVFRYEGSKMIYIHAVGMGGNPQFVLFRRRYRKYNLKNFTNTFYFNKHDGRVEIIEFLLSKNVILEVRTDFDKKDKGIIDMVKKKYPKNIRLYP